MSGALKRITTAEGEAVPMEKNGFAYHYFIKDHLGSTRVVLNQNSNIEQQNSYYPFGMLMAGLPATGSYTTPNRYLYNGKELQDDFGLEWYDYGARFYDAQLARFHTVDPLAEDPKNNIYISPYVYVGNNPITFLDPNGMNRDWFQNELTGDVYYNSKMRKGDEGTGAMTGEGWVHMGENGMFSDGENGQNDITALKENGVTTNIYTSTDVDGNKSTVTEASMKGEQAKSFMNSQGYDFNPIQIVKYIMKPIISIQHAPRQPNIEMNITEKSRYMKNDFYETGYQYISPLKENRDLKTYSNVGRCGVFYGNNFWFNSFVKGYNILFPSSPIKIDSWSKYNNNIDLINKFRETYGTK